MPPITQFVPQPKAKPTKANPGAAAVRGIASVAPPPPPPPRSPVGAVAHAFGAGAANVAHATQAATSAAVRGTANAAASPAGQGAYARALIDSLNHQPAAQQLAIIKGALHNPRSFEAQTILNYAKTNGPLTELVLKDKIGPDTGLNALRSVEHSVGSLLGAGSQTEQQQLAASRGLPTNVEGGLTQAGHALSGLIDKIPHGQQGGPGQLAAVAAGVPNAGQIGINAAKDFVNLGAEIGPSIAIPVGQLLSAHPGRAFDTAIGTPVSQFAADPKGFLTNHPLDAALMVVGGVHPVTHLAEAGLRRVFRKKPANLQSPSVHLTGRLTKERPKQSKYPLIRVAQKERAAARYHTNLVPGIDSPAGALVPRREAVRGQEIRSGTSQEVGIRERIRRAGVAAQIQAHAKAVLPSVGKRFVYGVKTALKNNPRPGVIPRAEMLARIADHTLRRPETALADLIKHRDRIAATRGDLAVADHLGNVSRAAAEHDKYIKALNAEIKSPHDWHQAFAAADELHAPDYHALENTALLTDHFGHMTRDSLDRRALQPGIVSHMPGARLDSALGMVVDEPHPAYARAAAALREAVANVAHAERATASRESMSAADAADAKTQLDKLRALLKKIKALADRPGTKGEGLAALARATVVHKKIKALEARLRDHGPRGTAGIEAARRHVEAMRTRLAQAPRTRPRPLSTREMREFDRTMTGGRPAPSYSSHQAPKGNSAFYVNSQRYPRREIKANTLYAYHHGLTDPSHEALLSARVHLQGVNDAHRSMDHLLRTLTVGREGGGHWDTYEHALKDAPPGYSPINVGRMPNTRDPTAISEKDNHHAATIDEEASKHSLSLNARLQPSDARGTWNLIHDSAKKQLEQHIQQISPNEFTRSIRWATGQFRQVALGTSIRHIPGIVQEGLIRDIASGVFIQHWLAEKNVYNEAAKINPQLAADRRVQFGTGSVAGGTRALETKMVAAHFADTKIAPFVSAFQSLMRRPGVRQLGTAWRAWTHFMLDNVEKTIEIHQDRAGVGKQLLNEFGGVLKLQGEAAQFAAVHGYLPEIAARRLMAGNERIYGKWTDQTPNVQNMLMFSPFGMWWVNSVKWLARLPVDHPIGTGALASDSVGTEKQRIALGLDMFAPGHLPLYEQGGIPTALGLVGSNYYSPAGVANDPLSTAFDMILPQVKPLLEAASGNNWLGKALTSPADPGGYAGSNPGERAKVMINSLLGLFIPVYTKLQTIFEGGASPLGTSTLWSPQTKGPNPGPLAGLEKAVNPLRIYRSGAGGTASSGGLDFGSAGSGAASSSGGLDFGSAGSGGSGGAAGGSGLDFSNAGGG